MNRPQPLSRAGTLVVLAVAAFVVALATSASAMAANCGKQVVDDWYDNGRVDRIYPLSCYRQAIRILPTDVIDYSNAKEEIGRALAFAKQGKSDPGSNPTSTGTTPTTTPTTPTETTPSITTPTETVQTTPETETTETDTAPLTEAGGSVDTSGPSSVPVPLIVLGGLAVLLLAAGAAGYLARRASGRSGGDGPPPASA